MWVTRIKHCSGPYFSFPQRSSSERIDPDSLKTELDAPCNQEICKKEACEIICPLQPRHTRTSQVWSLFILLYLMPAHINILIVIPISIFILSFCLSANLSGLKLFVEFYFLSIYTYTDPELPITVIFSDMFSMYIHLYRYEFASVFSAGVLIFEDTEVDDHVSCLTFSHF